MDFPFLLLVLLALPVVAAGVILAVSLARRRSHGPVPAAGSEPVHRLQAGTAAAQESTPGPPAAAPRAASARLRRAASAPRQPEG